MEEQQLKELNIKNYLYQAIDHEILDIILYDNTFKDIWDSMKQNFQRTTRVKSVQVYALGREFDILHMKEDEIVNSYFAHTLKIAKSMKACGKRMQEKGCRLCKKTGEEEKKQEEEVFFMAEEEVVIQQN